MSSIKGETGSPMIELGRSRIPVQEVEVWAVMFGMAAHARRFRSRHEDRMQSALLLQARRDLLMTVETKKSRRSRRNGVALYATCWAVEIMMCARKRTR